MKKPSLAEALSSPERPASAQTAQAVIDRPRKAAKPANGQAPSRVGKKIVAGYYAPEVSKQLRRMSLDMDRSVENLLGEALNDFFQKYKKPTIA